ncbi:MAG: hypothetical protein AAFQ66_13105 [Pseudomonadota bacterium]
MTKTIAIALVALTGFASAAAANTSATSLESTLQAYPVEINVNALTKSERAHVAAVLASGDSQAEINRQLKSIAN